jgi:hypothetical protein
VAPQGWGEGRSANTWEQFDAYMRSDTTNAEYVVAFATTDEPVQNAASIISYLTSNGATKASQIRSRGAYAVAYSKATGVVSECVSTAICTASFSLYVPSGTLASG